MLAVERNPELVAQWAGRIALVEADAANPEALEQLGAREFPVAVVGVGSYLEASVLITGNLVDIGVPQIWAKAISNEHARILQRIGAHHVVLPEADAGARVAHLVSGKLLDYIEVEDGFTIVKMRPPKETQGFTLAQSKVRERYGVTVIGVKSPGIDFVYATPETRLSAQRPDHRLGPRRPAGALRGPPLTLTELGGSRRARWLAAAELGALTTRPSVRRRGRQRRRITRRRCRTTKISSRAPMKILVHHELRVPSNVMIVWIRPSTSTPSTDPRTKPLPPVSRVPPMTTAAMASSSMPTPVSA